MTNVHARGHRVWSLSTLLAAAVLLGGTLAGCTGTGVEQSASGSEAVELSASPHQSFGSEAMPKASSGDPVIEEIREIILDSVDLPGDVRSTVESCSGCITVAGPVALTSAVSTEYLTTVATAEDSLVFAAFVISPARPEPIMWSHQGVDLTVEVGASGTGTLVVEENSATSDEHNDSAKTGESAGSRTVTVWQWDGSELVVDATEEER